MDEFLTSERVVARLRAIRDARGIRAEELASRTGLPRSTISNLETGRRKSITVDELVLISTRLDVDPRRIMTDQPLVISVEQVATITVDREV